MARLSLPRMTRRRVLGATLVALLAYLAVRSLVNSSDELLGAADLVGRPHVGWLLVAIATEVASYACYAAAQRRLLRGLGHRTKLVALTGLAAAAQAIGQCVPGGYTWNNVYCFRVLRRWHVGALAATRLLLSTTLLYIAALALLAIVGAQLPQGNGPAGEVRVLGWVVLAILALAGGLTLWRRDAVRHGARVALDRLERRFPRLHGPLQALEPWRQPASERRPLGKITLTVGGAWFLLSWVADAGCLTAAFAATGGTPPWSGLLVAYTAGQLAALLPITPGGLGVVEGSLSLALVTYGGAQVTTLAAVLLYRLISFWGLLPAGGVCYLLLRRESAEEVEER